MNLLTNQRNHDVKDPFFVICDGRRISEVVGSVWPLSTVQTCIILLIRGTCELASSRIGTL